MTQTIHSKKKLVELHHHYLRAAIAFAVVGKLGVLHAGSVGLAAGPIMIRQDTRINLDQAIAASHLSSSPRSSSLTVGGPRGGTRSLGSADIVINPNPTLSANPAALAAFNRAAATWEKYISDPVTVTIDAGLAALGPGILGQSGSIQFSDGGYDNMRDALVADNLGSPLAALTSALPTAAQYSAISAFPVANAWTATKADTKSWIASSAYGLTPSDLDAIAGTATDAQITFSTAFPFDYNNSDGVSPGTYDFESVALHEIGHALGFVSEVDYADFLKATGQRDALYVAPFDLFRFQDGTANDPSTLAEFTSKPRFLDTGGTAVFDLISPPQGPAEYGLSTGSDTGDGYQASHWKEENLYGSYIGVMDPALASGQIAKETYADVAALDVMGWDITYSHVPDSTGAGSLLMSLGMLGIFQWQARRKA